VAVEGKKSQILQEILKWIKEKPTPEDVTILLLAIDDKGRTVFHVAAETYKLEILQDILKWAKEKLTPKEINRLLLATNH